MGALSSELKKNICDISHEEYEIAPSSLEDELKDKIKNSVFFTKDFEQGSAQNIIDKVKSTTRQSPPSNDLNLSG
jgi:hypothetical protein